MDLYAEFLTLYIEILLGAVAFMTIVATLRQALVEAMPAHHYLVVRFLVEVGMSHVFLAMLALGLIYSALDPEVAIRWTIYAFATFSAPYLIFHIIRRARQQAPTPTASALVMTGYVAMVAGLIVTATERFWPPSMEIIGMYLLWVFLAHMVIFFMFLGSFFRLART